MEAALIIFSIPLLLFLPGLLVLPPSSRKLEGLSWVEIQYLRVLISFFVTSLAGVVLAQARLFSLASLVALLLAVSAGFLVFRTWKRTPRQPSESGPEPRQAARRFQAGDLWVLPLLAASLFIGANHFECITGGGDAGVYVNSGVLISKTGGFVLEDEFFESLRPKERRLFTMLYGGKGVPSRSLPRMDRTLLSLVYEDRAERFKGLFLDDGGLDSSSRPQFFQLLPVWMAVFHRWGGLNGILLVNVFLGFLSLLAVHYFGIRAFGGKPATGVIVSGLMAANLAQAWFMRYPTAEILVQMLFCSGAYLVLVGSRRLPRTGSLLIWGGAMIGAATMAKFFGLFLLIPLLAAWYFSTASKGGEEKTWWRLLFTGLIPTALYGLAGGFLFSSAYIRLHLFNRSYIKFYLSGILLLALSLVIRRWIGARMTHYSGLGSIGTHTRRLLAALAGVAAIYGYFIRPRDIEAGGSNNLPELGWYVSPVILLLGVSGFILYLVGTDKDLPLRRVRFFPWIAVVATIVVMSGTADMPLHIFSIRRMIPVTIPAFYLFSLIPLRLLWRSFRPAGPLLAAAAISAAALLPLLGEGWTLFTHREQLGLVDQLEDFAGGFGVGDTVIFDDFKEAEFLALPLRVIFDHQRTLIYYGKRLPGHIRFLRFLQRPHTEPDSKTYFITRSSTVMGMKPLRSVSLSWPQLELTSSRLPTESGETWARLNVFEFPAPEKWGYSPDRIDVGGDDFLFVEGFQSPSSRMVTYRQYFRRLGARSTVTLPAGTAKVTLKMRRLGSSPAPVELRFDGRVVKRIEPDLEFSLFQVKLSSAEGIPAESELVLSAAAEEPGPEGEAFSGAVLQWVRLEGTDETQTVELDEEPVGRFSRCGPVEWEDEQHELRFRWSRGSSRIRVPGPAARLRLVLSRGSRPSNLRPPKVRILLNGRLVKTVNPGRAFETVDIDVMPAEYGLPHQILTLESTVWNPYRQGRGKHDTNLGVVVEGVDIVRPFGLVETGLVKLATGHPREALSMLQRHAEDAPGDDDWRIPLGLGLAYERLGFAGRSREALKQSLMLQAGGNEALSTLRRLALRHDAQRTDESWIDTLSGEEQGFPAAIPPAAAGGFTLALSLETDGRMILQLVVRHEDTSGTPGGEDEDEKPRPRCLVEVAVDGVPFGRVDLAGEGWRSYVLSGECGPDPAHRVTLSFTGEGEAVVQRIQAF